MDTTDAADARLVLGCRADASRAEVMAAYRRAVRRTRPDLGVPGAPKPAELQQARDVLLAEAGEDRRRRPREETAGRDMTGYRRSRWGLVDDGGNAVDRHI